jgi:GTP-binding protein EngB required for normal cell division
LIFTLGDARIKVCGDGVRPEPSRPIHWLRLMTPTGRSSFGWGASGDQNLRGPSEGFLLRRQGSVLMSALNENHRRHLLHAFLAIEEGLANLEALIVQSETPSPLSAQVRDLSPTESRVVRDHVARIRAAMTAHLQELAIPLEIRRKSLRWSVETSLIHLQTIVDDMGSGRMAGYGPLDSSGQAIIARIQDDLTRLFDRACANVRQRLGRDLASRLARLDATQASIERLAALERIVTRWQLVEYRPTLEMIVSRLEKPCFEIAVFGRVSSGKSSLLNHLAGSDVLPVGVTPVTAVPTRLEHGQSEAAIVSFSESHPRRIAANQLWEYASEEGNPGNSKHVTRIVVQLPSRRMKSGVVLVDTPGVGSLATSGAAEALAYLPRCDLGIVLIDAASAPNREDLGLLQALYESGVPAMVLLSKADLLSSSDRARMTAYIGRQLHDELGLDLPLHPVSVVGADESLLLRWFDSEIAPLLERHQALAEASIRRKIAAVSESVAGSLETMLRRSGVRADSQMKARLEESRRLLDEADNAIRRAREQAFDWSTSRDRLLEILLQRAAAVASQHSTPASDDPLFHVAQDILPQRAGMARDLVAGLEKTLRAAAEGLRREWPLADDDSHAPNETKSTGLPAADLDRFHARSSKLRPWWARAHPGLARLVARRRLETRFGEAIATSVDTYDRQLQAWTKVEVERLTQQYELSAAPIREQVRRLATIEPGSHEECDGQDRRALQEALDELRGGEPGELWGHRFASLEKADLPG